MGKENRTRDGGGEREREMGKRPITVGEMDFLEMVSVGLVRAGEDEGKVVVGYLAVKEMEKKDWRREERRRRW